MKPIQDELGYRKVVDPDDALRKTVERERTHLPGVQVNYEQEDRLLERGRETMLYMVIESFRNHDAEAVYRRFREKGRMLPDGLKYIDSWVDVNRSRCFQLMECDDAALFRLWVACWDDLVDFEIVAVQRSKDVTAGAETGIDGSDDPTSRRGLV
jgi:hypothetical protein